MKNLATTLKSWRVERGLKMKELVGELGIDQALISKIENGKRIPTDGQLKSYSQYFGQDYAQLKVLALVESIVELVKYEPSPAEILRLSESRLEYLRSPKVLDTPTWSTENEERLARIDSLRSRWQAAHPLSESHLSKLQEYFKVDYTYESNRIEGNTLTLRETDLVVHQGLTIGGKSMREHLEAINHGEAIDFIHLLVNEQEPITERSLLELHHLILRGVDTLNAGIYRKVPVRISGYSHLPPEPLVLKEMMKEYFIHFERQRHRLHPVILAAEMHERLVSIHPFVDGNGRTSRLVMNLILLQHGYTIANLKGDVESRLRYYEALDAVQRDGNTEPFYLLVCEAVERSLHSHLEWVN